MLSIFRYSLLIIAILCSFSCKKENSFKNEDQFLEEVEKLSESALETPGVGLDFIEIKWKPVVSSHFNSVTYTLYLDDKKVVEGLSVTKYSFIRLVSGKEYKIKVLAITPNGNEQSLESVVSTLPMPNGQNAIHYQEYAIYDYASFTGSTALVKLKDGGHIVNRLLLFSGGAHAKLCTFRVDKYGQMLWYRLSAPEGKRILGGGEAFIALTSNEQEAVIFVRDFAFKLSVNTGEPLLYKDFNTSDTNLVTALHQISEKEVVIGAGGGLMSVDLVNLQVLWSRDMQLRQAWVRAIASNKGKLFFLRDTPPDPSSNSSSVYLYESNLKGEITSEVNLNIFVVKLSLLIDDNDNIYVFSSLVDFQNNIVCLKLDPTKKVLKNIKISDGLSAVSAFFGNSGEIIAYGRRDGAGLNVWSGIYVFDKDLNVIRKRIYNEKQTNSLQAVSLNTDGSYNLFLHLASTSNFTFIKTDLNGNMF